MVDIKIYDNPKLVERVEPGHILEALPGANETKTEESPSNVFGYVNGRRDTANFKTIPSYGDLIMAQRIIPVGIDGSNVAERLCNWTTDKSLQYLVIGEILNHTYGFVASSIFTGDGLVLNDIDLGDLRNRLIDFSIDRGSMDYVFTTPSGEKFSLSEIILNLQQVPEKVT